MHNYSKVAFGREEERGGSKERKREKEVFKTCALYSL